MSTQSYGNSPPLFLPKLLDQIDSIANGNFGAFGEPPVAFCARAITDLNNNIILTPEQLAELSTLIENITEQLEAAIAGMIGFSSHTFPSTPIVYIGMNSLQILSKNPVTIQDNGFSYTQQLNILAVNALAGAQIEFQLNWPSNSTNPTVTIFDDASSDILYTETANGNSFTYSSLVKFVFNGTNWMLWES